MANALGGSRPPVRGYDPKAQAQRKKGVEKKTTEGILGDFSLPKQEEIAREIKEKMSRSEVEDLMYEHGI
ncbi:hypothetical protein KAZ93_01990 [Patescibacteria group bacterium]|nr:hypothetical protein [Patescibacteria group bacterium]